MTNPEPADMLKLAELAQGLRDTARWIRAKDPLATNYLYCLQAVDELEREREIANDLGESASIWRTRACEAEAAVERVRAAINFIEPPPRDELDRMLAWDIANGMSLRTCAKKHGVNVGRVRGAISRAALNGSK